LNAWQRVRAWLAGSDRRPQRARYELGRDVPESGFRRLGRLESLRLALERRAPSPEKWLYATGLRSARALTLPEVLGIGAQKAGTTWLYQNLAAHPEVFVPPHVKEVHYFDLLFRRKLADYAAVFADGAGRVKCDVTPSYGKLPPARIRFVRRVMPDARLVFLMRNPVERAWSQAVMDLATRTGRDPGSLDDDALRAHFRNPRIVENGLYTRILERWLAHFPEDRLFVGFYEDVCERPRELLGRLFDHIGVSRQVEWEAFPVDERVFAGPGPVLPEAHRAELQQIFGDEIRRLAGRYGGAAAAWNRP
jgi:hypothetical protein